MTNDYSCFKFKFKNVNCILGIKKMNKICNPRLYIENSEKFTAIKNSHLEENGYACLSFEHNILTAEETVVRVLDWLNVLNERYENDLGHLSGYRHGFQAVVEEYFSIHGIPLLEKFANDVNESELVGIARKNDSYKNETSKSILEYWKKIKENWSEEMS